TTPAQPQPAAQPAAGAVAIPQDKIKPMLAKAVELRRDGKYADAIKIYEKLIQAFPNNEEYYFLKATCLRMAGNFAEALVFYNKALEINEGYAMAFYGKEMCEEELSKGK
ncbi:MAG: tetratricopeptide repeat protein, partial [Thermoplasmata archaeon]